MKVPFLDLKSQHNSLKSQIMSLVSNALDKAAFIGGSQVENFEREFAEFCEARACVGVSSGTDALRFALLALGIGPGDEVITVPNTFIATTEAISQVGAKPVFVDIDPDTYNMDVSLIKSRITIRTKVLLPVHLYGQPADMDPIKDIALEHDLIVIEDACQAHGARYKDQRAGSISHAGCFSFYPGKNLGACGEGGAVVTQDAEIAQKVRMLRDHGQKKKYFHEIEGYNGRLDAIQAGILRIKLKKLEEWNTRRRLAASWYNELLSEVPGIKTPTQAGHSECVYHLYVILADRRDELMDFLGKKGISTGLHYPLPLHLQKAYRHLGHGRGDFPVAEDVSSKLLSLPIFPEITREQVKYVAENIRRFYNTYI